MLNKFLAIVLLILSLASCNIDTQEEQRDSDPTDSEEQSGNIDAATTKSPLEMYRAAEELLKSLTNYEMSMVSQSHVTYGSSVMDSKTETLYKVYGDDVYYSYAENGETVSQRWFVDGYLYRSDAISKERVEMSVEEHKKNLGTPSDGNLLLALEDSMFEGLSVQKDEDLYVLNIELSAENYKKYVGADIIEPASYVIYFDANETLVRMHMKAKQSVYGMFLVEGSTDIYLKNVGTTESISAPDDAEDYRVPASFEDIDLSTIDSLDSLTPSESATDYVKIDVKDMGSIVIRLYSDVAPASVANFKKLVSENFYDGLIFHRVIKDFMIQGGCPKGDGTGGSSANIPGEFSSNGFTNNLAHVRGVVSMARSSNDPNSASSQFFIVHKDSAHLNGNYAAFGFVVYGMDVVDAIAGVETNDSDKPLENIVIESIRFVTINE